MSELMGADVMDTAMLHREFSPVKIDGIPNEEKGGTVNVWTDNYGSRLDKFDGMFDLLVQDGLSFVPPLEITTGLLLRPT